MKFSLQVSGLLLIAGLATVASQHELGDESMDLTPEAAEVSPRHDHHHGHIHGHHHHGFLHHHDWHKHFHDKHKHFHHKHHHGWHHDHLHHLHHHHGHHHHHHPLLIKKKKKLVLFKIKKLLPHHHVLHIPHIFHHFHDKHKHHHHKKHHHHWRAGFPSIDSSPLIPVYPGSEGQDYQLFNQEGGHSYIQLIADEPATQAFAIPSDINFDEGDQFEQEQDAKLEDNPNEEENYEELQLEEPDSQQPFSIEELNTQVPPLYFYAPQQVDYGRSVGSTTDNGKGRSKT